MADSRGSLSRGGFKREAVVYAPSWPATSVATVAELLPITSANIEESVGFVEHEDVVGGGRYRVPTTLSQRYSGPLTIDPIPYQGLDEIWMCVMGFEQIRDVTFGLMPQTIESGAYRHLFEIDNWLADQPWRLGDGFRIGDGIILGQQKIRRGTLAIDRQVSVWEYRSAMFNGFSLNATPGKTSLTFDVKAYDLSLATSTNTSAALAALSRTPRQNVLYHQVSIWIDDYSVSTALTSADAINPSSFELKLDNRLNFQRHGVIDGIKISSPIRSGPPIINGRITLPRYANNTLITKFGSLNSLMMKVQFTGNVISGTSTNYSLTFWFPTIKMTVANPPLDGPGASSINYVFTAYSPAGEAASFPSDIKNGPLIIETVNGNSLYSML